jgi:hypothetical protein
MVNRSSTGGITSTKLDEDSVLWLLSQDISKDARAIAHIT